MFRPIARISSRRLFSITPRRSNLIGDLYVQSIRQFKPQALSQEEIDSAVKKFQLPGKPTIPQIHELSTEQVKEYEQSEVEAEAAQPTENASETKPDEDWFVFDEVEAEGH
ncbi:ATP14 [Candida margitis]|uniref:ATP14 n=1 Tax=Candida margitis TaxID=1775924 RepID=UPI0022264797|nr:ATP14 [Candida margitis]KAI5969445.1 ATP14 [Candida margitis]